MHLRHITVSGKANTYTPSVVHCAPTVVRPLIDGGHICVPGCFVRDQSKNTVSCLCPLRVRYVRG